jgi:hypothetical protein
MSLLNAFHEGFSSDYCMHCHQYVSIDEDALSAT